MSITGEPGGEPQKVGVAVSDIFTGPLFGDRHPGGTAPCRGHRQGQHIDMALLDTQVSVLGNQNLNYLVSGKAPVQMGNAHMNIAPYEVLPVKPTAFHPRVGNDGQFQRFCKVVGLDHLPTDPDFAHQRRPGRQSRGGCASMLIATLAGWERDALLPLLDKAAGVPASPINNIAEMFADPQVIARGMRVDLDDGQGNTLPSVRAPMVMSGTPLEIRAPLAAARASTRTKSSQNWRNADKMRTGGQLIVDTLEANGVERIYSACRAKAISPFSTRCTIPASRTSSAARKAARR
jgi:crotonobetainyl-CoA:carnitine CoA-transferase CaiB-like acyl-CoA transferase